MLDILLLLGQGMVIGLLIAVGLAFLIFYSVPR